MAVLISLSMIVSVSGGVGRAVLATLSTARQKGHLLLNPVLLRRKKKNKVALKEVIVVSERVAPFLMVGGLYERNENCRTIERVSHRTGVDQTELLTIGKHGNTQPRSRDRKKDLEIGSAEGGRMSFWWTGINNPPFHALGENGSQNAASNSATTLSK